MPGLDIQGYLPSSQSGTHVIFGCLGLGLRSKAEKKFEKDSRSVFEALHKQPDDLGTSGVS